MKKRIWTRNELIVAFNLYLKLPFGKMHRNNPEIIHLSKLINRTPSAVAMRLTNFANIDPYHKARGVSGLSGGKNQCQPIWDEFNSNREDLLFESEKIKAELEDKSIESKYAFSLQNISNLTGETKIREVKTRINQNVFRQIILSNYLGKCVVSGIDIQELLVASHIIPWSKNKKERLNPANGLCLSVLYDKAFDKGFIGISLQHKILLSNKLKQNSEKNFYSRFFGHIEGSKIQLPERFQPNKEFLEYHLDHIFEK
jgi:predicted restriction endonuclease